MECETCRRFPAPSSKFEELGESMPRHGTLYRCRDCGGYLETLVEARTLRRLSAAEAREHYGV